MFFLFVDLTQYLNAWIGRTARRESFPVCLSAGGWV